MAEAALCREESPDYASRPPETEIRRALRTIRKVFPGATLLEIRRTGMTRAARRPRPTSRHRPFGGPSSMV